MPQKDSLDFKNSFYLGFLSITSKPGKEMRRCPVLRIHNCKKTVWRQSITKAAAAAAATEAAEPR